MRREVLRMERVTYKEQGSVTLQDVNLHIFEGEIMGLLPLEAYGLSSLLDLLRNNDPLYDGYVYYREHMVNSWQDMKREYGHISIIRDETSLVPGDTAAHNIFVLRPGFQQVFLHERLFRRQLKPMLAEIGVSLSADTKVENLSQFERVIVELLRAIVSNHRLIVIQEAANFLNEHELLRLQDILHYYTKKGYAFLYISTHFEELRQICDRVAVFHGKRIQKILEGNEMTPSTFDGYTQEYDRRVRHRLEKKKQVRSIGQIFQADQICGNVLQGLDFTVARGECLVLQCQEQRIKNELYDMLVGKQEPTAGWFLIDGHAASFGRDRRIAVIQERSTQTMVFEELSYIDNLCFNMDHRVHSVWLSPKIKKSIRMEYSKFLGKEVFDKPVETLTELEKCELIYARILLQKPEIVFCMQPFAGADMKERMRIWQWHERMLNAGIAVVILTMNMADALSIADRVIRMERGGKITTYTREEFKTFPEYVPWKKMFEDM